MKAFDISLGVLVGFLLGILFIGTLQKSYCQGKGYMYVDIEGCYTITTNKTR